MTEKNALELAERIDAYLDDAPTEGRHSDRAGADAYELLREAGDSLRAGAEPVAWQWYFAQEDRWCEVKNCTTEVLDGLKSNGYKLRGLYTAQPVNAPPPEPITTEQLDKLQFGKVLHKRASPVPASVQEALALAREYISQDHANFADGGGDHKLTGDILEKIDAALSPAQPQAMAEMEDTTETVADEIAYFDAHAERFAASHKGIVAEREEREPDAWRWRSNEKSGWRAGPRRLSDDDLAREEDGFEEQPLYAAPPERQPTREKIIERCIAICMEEAEEWDSDRLQTYKNYAGHCANRISDEVLKSKPSEPARKVSGNE